MLVTSQEAELPGLIHELERSIAEVDDLFASVGTKLGLGLSVFEALTEHLSAVSDELCQDKDGTRTIVSEVVAEMRSFSGDLASGATALERIGQQGAAATKAVSRLLTQIRFVGAVARSARIEEASLSTQGGGRGIFAEIGGLVAQALEIIERSAREHGRLEALLGPAMRSQRGFAASYTAPLLSLAAELEASLDQVEQTRRGGAAMAATASRQARRIGDVVGGALIALQCGDSTRQRLEHARDTMALACAVASGTRRDLDGADSERIVATSARLAAAQLRETAEEMRRDSGQIDDALRILSEEIDTITGLGQAGGRGDARHIAAPLAALEANLSRASEMIGQCRAARQDVDQVTEAVTTLIGTFGTTSDALTMMVRDIVLGGMNASLHASRLGVKGASLVAIARELKSAADQIGENAATLLPILDEMQASLAGLTEQGSTRTERLVGLDAAMQASLGALKAKGTKLGEVLDTLAADSADFAASVDEARAAFLGARDIRQTILAAADREETMAGHLAWRAPDALVAAYLTREVLPCYTIATERTLFHRIIGSSPAATVAAAAEDTDGDSWEF